MGTKTLRARITLFFLEKRLQEAPFRPDPIFPFGSAPDFSMVGEVALGKGFTRRA
jgi:hypothetical protein